MAYVTAGVTALAAGFLVNLYGFRFLFVIMLVLSLIGLIVSLLSVVRKQKK